MRWLRWVGVWVVGLPWLAVGVGCTNATDAEVEQQNKPESEIQVKEGSLATTVDDLSLSIEPIRCLGHKGQISAVGISPDGKLAVSVSSVDLTLRFWDTSSGIEIRKIDVYNQPVSRGWIKEVVFSADGKQVAATSFEQPIQFWDVASGNLVKENCRFGESARGLAISPADSMVACGKWGSVEIWDSQDCKMLHEFHSDDRNIGLAAEVIFSPDGTRLAAALYDNPYDGRPLAPKVRIWNTSTWEETAAFWKQTTCINDIDFSLVGNLFAAVSENGELCIWNLMTNEVLLKIQADEHSLFCLAFSPDGKTLATGGNNPSIKLWDVSSGNAIGELKGHADQVKNIAFSSDGRVLLSAGRDKSLLLWPLNNQERQTHK